jgi:sulfur-carrier protein
MATILYFAWVRDAVGVGEEVIEIPDDAITVGALAAFLATRSEGHARAFADPARLRAAVDLAMVGFDAPIAGAKEIAFFPPVTGG